MTTNYSANVSLWLECNLKCPYCFGNPLLPPKEWPTETGKKLDQMARFFDATGTWELDISGGEPTIYPGFGEFCQRLARGGHEVMFYSNGIKPFAEVFTDESAASLKKVTLSYQVALEKASSLDRIFAENIAYLHDHGVSVAVNYVLYPGRKDTPGTMRERMEDLGAEMQFRAFQGEYEGKQYPFAYTPAEINDFAEVGDIRARYFMTHDYFVPTYKKCRAGFETFYVSLRTGGVYLCEQLQQQELANYYEDDGVERFRARARQTPVTCPAKRCTCRVTVDQEKFLTEHDHWDMANYDAWEKLSLPTDRAVAYWGEKEQPFVDELAARLQGDEVYLWGGGVHTLILLKLLRERGFPVSSIKGVIDSNPLKQGQEILGVGIVGSDQVGWRDGKGCSDILISSRAFEDEIHAAASAEKAANVNLMRLYDGTMTNQYEAREYE